VIYTLEHSTRSLDQFMELLTAHQIHRLADVRLLPRSRRHPHFSRDNFERALAGAGIVYRHVPALGGMRKARADSTNIAWRHPSFRGFADYMETPAFDAAVDALLAFAAEGVPEPASNAAIMCAEAVWWQCHRQLIADALVARDIDVWHILSRSETTRHALTAFARVAGCHVTYPGLGL